MNELNPLSQPAAHLSNRGRELDLPPAGFIPQKYISIEGSQFAAVDEAGNRTPIGQMGAQGVYLDIVIVDANPVQSRMYFDQTKKYSKDNPEAPLCWSDNGQAPSVNAIQPQAMRCDHTCPQNVRGSAIGQKGHLLTACKPKQKLAVLTQLPGLWLFAVPTASLKHLGTYRQWLKRQQVPGAGRNADLPDVVTRIRFIEPNIIGFDLSDMGWIPANVAVLEDQLWESGACDELVGKNDQPRQGALPAPTAVQPAAISAPVPQAAPPAPPPSQPSFGGIAAAPPAAEPPKPRGRPKKEKPAQELPAFLAAPPEPPAQSQPQFGMAQPTPANPDLSAAVADAFRLA